MRTPFLAILLVATVAGAAEREQLPVTFRGLSDDGTSMEFVVPRPERRPLALSAQLELRGPDGEYLTMIATGAKRPMFDQRSELTFSVPVEEIGDVPVEKVVASFKGTFEWDDSIVPSHAANIQADQHAVVIEFPMTGGECMLVASTGRRWGAHWAEPRMGLRFPPTAELGELRGRIRLQRPTADKNEWQLMVGVADDGGHWDAGGPLASVPGEKALPVRGIEVPLAPGVEAQLFPFRTVEGHMESVLVIFASTAATAQDCLQLRPGIEVDWAKFWKDAD
jgi:hypothetical protein